jgi:hypothetical protein
MILVGLIVQISATDKWYQMMMGRWVAGLGVGALSLLVPMYQAETGPRHIRGALIRQAWNGPTSRDSASFRHRASLLRGLCQTQADS